jgi:hypothetical protein
VSRPDFPNHDLAERIAELESTAARKGNQKVELKITGVVNRALLFWDDGAERARNRGDEIAPARVEQLSVPGAEEEAGVPIGDLDVGGGVRFGNTLLTSLTRASGLFHSSTASPNTGVRGPRTGCSL